MWRAPGEGAVGVLQEQLLFAERGHHDDHHVILVLLGRQHGHGLHDLGATKLSDANCSLHSPPDHPSIHPSPSSAGDARSAGRVGPCPGSTRAIAAAAAYCSLAAASSSVLPDALDRSSDAYARNAAAVGGLLSDLRSRISQIRKLLHEHTPKIYSVTVEASESSLISAAAYVATSSHSLTHSLLTPYRTGGGELELAHRVVLAPLTRQRSPGNLPQPHAAVYYAQRATAGGMLITEATGVSAAAQGHRPTPGVWTAEEVDAWRPIVDAVHAKGAVIFCQLWHVGRFNSFVLSMSMALGLQGSTAWKSTARTGMARAIPCPPERSASAGIRLSPFADYMDCHDSDPHAPALHMATKLKGIPGGILYLHMVEPRMARATGRRLVPKRLRPYRKAFGGTFIAAGGYDMEEGNKVVGEGYADLVSFGRLFLANSDLPKRFELDAELNGYDRATFYTSDPVVGCTDYPFFG
ncbi:12-oxophytodienoic acid reductase 1-A1du [Hordeum vulgare]|nr:12-oxophytodienoic acid reductase 1-A1du [Hordeum vulgare]